MSCLFLFSLINAAVAQVNFIFTEEPFQSVPMTGERDYTQTNESQYIMSYWRNCTSTCCLLFDERMNSPILTSCETSCDTAPALSMETNNLALLWTQAMKVHISDIQGCCRQDIPPRRPLFLHWLVLQVYTNYRRCVSSIKIIKFSFVRLQQH